MRAANMQALTVAVQSRWPGVTVYGIGDAAHKTRASDHNEDDLDGSKPAQTDKDTRPEHRAIDIMIGSAFTKSDADALVAAMLRDPATRARLYGIIWNGSQWWRSTGFTRQARTTDPHTDHVHVSGLAADDENTAGWPVVGEGVLMTEMFPRYGEDHDGVGYVQYQLENLGHDVGKVDNDYGPATAKALAAFVKAYNGSTVDGKRVTPAIKIYLDVSMMRKFGKPGPAGAPGKNGVNGKDGAPGKDGRDGMLVIPQPIQVEAVVKPVA